MAGDMDLSTARWVRSSYSGSDGGQCVEISPSYVDAGLVPVRDSKASDRAPLVFPTAEWSSFIRAVRSTGPMAPS